MLRTKFRLLAIVQVVFVSAAFVATTAAQPGTKLRYAFLAGQKISVTQTESTHDTDENVVDQKKTETANTKEINQSWVVKSVSPDGDATIEVHYTGIRMAISPAPGIEIIVNTAQTIKDSNPFLVQLGAQAVPVMEKLETNRKVLADLFIPRTFSIVVSNTGVVKSVGGFDEAMDNYRLQVEKMVPDKLKRAELDTIIEALFGDDAVNKTFSYTLFTALPIANASPGTEWADTIEFVVGPVHMPIKRTSKFAGSTGPAFKIDETTTFGVPTATEELEFKLVDGTIKDQIALDPTNVNIMSQDYQGVLGMEAYGRQLDGHPLILRMSSTFRGTVRMIRVP